MSNNRLLFLSVLFPALLAGAGGLATPAVAQFVVPKTVPDTAPPPPPPAQVAAPSAPAADTASSSGPMTVTDVIIDKTDKNAVLARDEAIVEAQRTAFEVLAEKSMSPEAFKAYKIPDNKTIATLVDNFEIKNEQLSATRYVANFTVRFLPDINNYLKIPESLGKTVAATPPAAAATTTAAAPATPASPATTEAHAAAAPAAPASEAAPPATAPAMPQTVLVLPYYEDAAGKKVLWEDPNPWREAWQATGSSAPDANLTVTVPLGDLGDVSSGDTNAVWKGNYDTIEKSRVNYNATEVALAVAHAGKGIDLYLYKDGKLEHLKPIGGKYSDADSYKKAIAKVIAELKAPVVSEEHTAKATAEKTEKPAAETEAAPAEEKAEGKVSIEATMNFSSEAQWMEAQKRLAEISPPVDLEISGLSKDQAQFTMDFNGGLAALKTALAGKGLELDRPTVQVDESVLGSAKPTQKTVYELRLLN